MSNTGLGKNLSKLYELYCENGGGVTTDSRAVASLTAKNQGVGPIFFALKGENFDGNDYAVQAMDDGAAGAVVQGRLPEGIAAGSDVETKYFVVEDALAALQELAAYHREVLGLTVIALTGSNGKTTTKELMARVLRLKYRVACTQGNLNNHIGVPLTLLAMTDEDDVAIVEMGANHRGEIAELCEMARPNIGLITNVGRAHLEGFGGPEGVRKGKGELYDFLAKHNGTAIYAADDEVLTDMVAERFSRTGHAMGYACADWGLSAVSSTASSTVSSAASSAAGGRDLLSLVIADGDDGESHKVETQMVGRYNLSNIAAAVAVGQYFGIRVREALEAVAGYAPDNNRSQVAPSANKTGNTLYMDAYNANPSSMEAALDNFLTLPDFAGGARGVVILGDMRELGDFSAVEHRRMIDRLSTAVTDGGVECYLVGPEFTAALSPDDPAHMRAFQSTDELAAAIESKEVVIRGAHVLIKGSRGLALEKLYRVL